MFTQADRSVEKAHGGLGIGLTLVRRLVDLHGGRVEARSDGPGCGSEFIVRVPALVEAPQEHSPLRTEAPAVTSTGQKVLVLDDNRDAADTLSLMMRLMGNDIRTAYDAPEALRVAAEFSPTIALLDLGLPGMSGYSAAQAIRREPWGKDMILVAVTGWGQETDRARSRDAGFDHHLVKPVAPDDILEILASLPRV